MGPGAIIAIMRKRQKSLSGMVFCISAATILSLILRDPDTRLAAPILCTLAVMASSFLWGRAAAILGAAAATLIFDLFLFPPIGSMRVSDPVEGLALALLAWSAVVASLMTPPDPAEASREARRRNNLKREN
jgi:K+-sensing histidine kinase KdpD